MTFKQGKQIKKHVSKGERIQVSIPLNKNMPYYDLCSSYHGVYYQSLQCFVCGDLEHYAHNCLKSSMQNEQNHIPISMRNKDK